ncbi:MAG: SDR family oxidoreductase [Woeseia sp.]
MKLVQRHPSAWLLAVLMCALCLPAAHAKTVLITGANSGIGLEFATQYAADGWQVVATHRRDGIPRTLADLASRYDGVQVEFLDVTDHASIDALAAKLSDRPIDVLLNNAGVVGELDDPAQKFGTLDYEMFGRYLQTNTLGPLRVAEAFYAHVRRSEDRKIVGISTIAASLEGASQAMGSSFGIRFRYAYNVSKAALNMAYIGLANDARADGIVVGLLHPGLVRVARTERYDMTPQMEAAMLEVDDSVTQMRALIEGLNADTSGSFLAYDGSTVPW